MADNNGILVDNNYLFAFVLAGFISVSLAVIAVYYSYIYLLAIFLFIGSAVIFLLRPEWFLYFLAFSRISLDAVKLFSFESLKNNLHWSLSLDGVVNAMLFLFALVYFFKKRDIKVFRLPGAKAYLLFLIICLISLTISQDKIIGTRHYLHYLTYFLIYVLGVNILNTKEKNHKLIIAIFLSALIPLIVGFYQAITISGNLQTGGFNRICATVNHPNGYAFYLMIISIFLFTMDFYTNSFRNKLFLFLFAIPILLSLILTYSRGAWLGTGLGMGIYVLMVMWKPNFRNFIPLLIFLFVILILLSLFAPLILARFSDLTGVGMGSFGWRNILWGINFKAFLRNPLLGHGIGSAGMIAKESTGWIIFPHNDYLKLMVETGIFGFIAYSAAMIELLLFCLKRYRENEGNKKGILASGLFALTISVLFVHAGDNVLNYDIVLVYFWFFAALAVNLINKIR